MSTLVFGIIICLSRVPDYYLTGSREVMTVMGSTCGDVRWLLTVPSDQLLAEVGYPAEVDTPPAASSADAAAAARLAHRSHPNLLQQHSPLILRSSAHKIFTGLLFLCVFSVSLQLAPISIAET